MVAVAGLTGAMVFGEPVFIDLLVAVTEPVRTSL